ncbi:MAG TPA: hypothetical protein VIB39_01615 [Candidatus Angelobacter sp.]|jgi:hypothetical protein
MKKRPIAVLILSCVLIVSGALGLAYHLSEFSAKPFHYEMVWISLFRLLAIVSGTFMLLSKNWARWLALAWITFHLGISFYHSLQQVAIHALVLAMFAYFLFRPEARAYFGHREATGATE